MFIKVVTLFTLTVLSTSQFSSGLDAAFGNSVASQSVSQQSVTPAADNPNANLQIGETMTIVTTSVGQRPNDTTGQNKGSGSEGSIDYDKDHGITTNTKHNKPDKKNQKQKNYTTPPSTSNPTTSTTNSSSTGAA